MCVGVCVCSCVLFTDGGSVTSQECPAAEAGCPPQSSSTATRLGPPRPLFASHHQGPIHIPPPPLYTISPFSYHPDPNCQTPRHPLPFCPILPNPRYSFPSLLISLHHPASSRPTLTHSSFRPILLHPASVGMSHPVPSQHHPASSHPTFF